MEKLALAFNPGETFLFNNGEWTYSAISGFQKRGGWNLAGVDNDSTSDRPDESLLEGDYYTIEVAGKIDNVDYLAGDWAIYNGSGFNKISNAEFMLSFNNRTGDIIACPGVGCENVYDYNWDKVVLGTDATAEVLSHFEDVGDYSALANTEADKKKFFRGTIQGVGSGFPLTIEMDYQAHF